MTDLLREIEYLIRAGATYIDAPTLGEEVLDRIDAFAARFLVYPSEHARHAHALWCAHAWLMDCWEHTPRLLFISPEAGCGKTRALTVTKHLVPRPNHVADLTRRPSITASTKRWSSRVVGRRSCTTSSTPCSAPPRKAESETSRCAA